MNRTLNPFDVDRRESLACPVPWCRARINQFCVDVAGEEVVAGHRLRRWFAALRRRLERPTKNVVAYIPERTFGTVPPATGKRITPAKVATGPMKGTVSVWGDVSFDCLKCSARVDTVGNAVSREYVFGGREASVTMAGVLCDCCRSSWTVTLTEKIPAIDDALTPIGGVMTVTPEPNPPAREFRRWLSREMDRKSPSDGT